MNLAGYQIHNVLKALTRRFTRRNGQENDVHGAPTDEQVAADVKRQLIIDHVSEKIISDIRELAAFDGPLPVRDGKGLVEKGVMSDFNAEPLPFTFNVIDENNVKHMQVWDPASSTNFVDSVELLYEIQASKEVGEYRLN